MSRQTQELLKGSVESTEPRHGLNGRDEVGKQLGVAPRFLARIDEDASS